LQRRVTTAVVAVQVRADDELKRRGAEQVAHERERLRRVGDVPGVHDRRRSRREHDVVRRQPAALEHGDAGRQLDACAHRAVRSSRLRILPTLVLGRSSRNSMYLGTLYPVKFWRQYFMTSSSVRIGSLFTTKTLMASPCFSSATPMAAHSTTPGHREITFSSSFGKTLKPLTRIMSFLRSTILV